MFVLGGLDCLEVPHLRGAGNVTHVRGVVFPGRSDSFVVFATEDSKVGGPPGFGIVGCSGHRCLLFQERYEAVE